MSVTRHAEDEVRSIIIPVLTLLAACGPRALPMPPSPALDPSTPPPAQPPPAAEAAPDAQIPLRVQPPRVLGIREVARAGEYRGVPVYVEQGHPASADILYLAFRPGCAFQPYVAVDARLPGARP